MTEKPKIWTRAETLSLLECYVARKDEFQHVRKKKFAYANILKDLMSLGTLETETTVAMIVAKMQSLLRSYKTAKENARMSGAGRCVGPFMVEMEEIFGNRFNDSINHTLNFAPMAEVKCEPELSIIDYPGELATSSTSENTKTSSTSVEKTSSTSENTTVKKSNETKFMKEIYCTKMLELKEKEIKDRKIERLKLFQMKEENAERRHKEKMEFLKYREAKAEKRHKETIELLNRIFP